MDRRASPATNLWLVFLGLSSIWGSSFLFIKIGLDAGLGPLTLVTYRLWIACLVLSGLAVATGAHIRFSRQTILTVSPLGLLNVAIPFTLITTGEQFTSSGLASILNSLVPLFTIVIAALVLHDEPITLNRLAGLIVGFGGAVLLLSPAIGASAAGGAGHDATLALLGELAIALAAMAYASAAVYTRARISGREIHHDPQTGPRALRPVETALPQNMVAAVVITILAVVLEHPQAGLVALPPAPSAWLAVAWLGALGSGVAYLFYFRLVSDWGPTRTMLVTYVMPIIGVGLGIAVLGESPDIRELAGCALIIAGVALVNARVGRRVLFGRGPVSAA